MLLLRSAHQIFVMTVQIGCSLWWLVGISVRSSLFRRQRTICHLRQATICRKDLIFHTIFSPSMLILDARAFVMAFFWQQHSCPHLVDERYSSAAVIRQVAMCIRKTSPCGRLPAMQVQQPLSRHGRDMKSTFTLRVLARWRTISSLHEVEVVHHVLPMKRG